VIWLQYALPPSALPAIVKIVLVFVGAVGFGWSVTAWLRRSPVVARVL
jgi:hypothetical protein